MAWYRTGTIAVTNGSTTVVGTGTSWIANSAVGEGLLAPDGRIYEIANIASNTSLTLGQAYLGATQSSQTYVIVPTQSYIRDLAAQAADLVNNYSDFYNTIGAGKFPDGELTAPAVKFSDDLDTGFYRSASNEVTFVAGGVAQFKYNTSGLQFTGNLDSPIFTGNVTFASGTANGVTYLNGSKVLTSGSTLTYNGTSLSSSIGGLILTNAGSSISTTSVNYGVLSGGVYVNTPTSNYGYLAVGGNAAVAWNTNSIISYISGSEQMRLTSTGLGIGTSSPITALHVQAGTVHINTISGNSKPQILLGSAGVNYGQIQNDNTGIWSLGYGATTSALGTPVLTWNSSGNVGIGTTSPTSKLSLGGNMDFQQSSNLITTTGFLNISPASTLILDTGDTILFRTSGTERARIDSAGNVGIGTSAPLAKLHVSGTGTVIQKLQTNNGAVEIQLIANTQSNASYSNIYSGDGSNWNWTIGGGNGTTNTMTLQTGGTERLRIDSTGNVGIGTSSPTQKLHIAGTALVTPTDGWITSGVATQYFGDVYGSIKYDYDTTNFLISSYGTFSIATNGTSPTTRLFIDGAGNLGLNVTPSAWGGNAKGLQITNYGSVSGNSSTGIVSLASNAYESANSAWNRVNGTSAGLYQISYTGTHTWSRAVASAGGSAIAWTQSMTLDSTGNVGIGTSSPSARLDIRNTGGTSDKGIRLQTNAGGNLATFWTTITDLNIGIAGAHIFTNFDGSAERVRITSTGNVGIGTSSPSCKLHIEGSGLSAKFNRTDNVAIISLQYNGVQGGFIGTPSIGATTFYNELATERLRIDSAGNVGIGTTTPSKTGHKAITINDSTLPILEFSVADVLHGYIYSNVSQMTLDSAGVKPITFLTNGLERARIDSSGHLIVPAGITLGTTAGTYNDANTLDDYEEGTWTPVDDSGAGLTFTLGACTYTKIGRMVTCYAVVTYPVTADASSAKIAGFPFNPSDRIFGQIAYTSASTAVVNYVQGSGAFVFLWTPGVLTTNASVSNELLIFSASYNI